MSRNFARAVIVAAAGLLTVGPGGQAAADPGLVVQSGHNGDVGSIVTSQDCAVAASVGAIDGSVRIYDLLSNGMSGVVDEGRLRANAALLSKDATKLVAATDGNVQILGANDGKPDKTYHASGLGDGGSLLSVALSADETLLAAGSNTGKVLVWDRARGSLIHTFTMGDNANDLLTFVAFTPDGKHVVATGSTGARIGVFSLGGEQHRTWESGYIAIDTAALSPDGKVLAIGGLNDIKDPANASLWDIASGKRLGKLNTKGVRATGIGFFADGASVHVAAGRTIGVYGRKSFKREKVHELPGGIVAMSKTCGVLVGLEDTGLVFDFDPRKPEQSAFVGARRTVLTSDILLEDEFGRVLVGSSVASRVNVSALNPTSGEMATVSSGTLKSEFPVTIEQIMPDARLMVVSLTSKGDDLGAVVDLEQQQVVHTVAYPGYVGNAFMLRDGKGLLVSGYQSPSIVESLKSGEKTPFPVSSVADVEHHPTLPLMAIRSWSLEEDSNPVISVYSTADLTKISESVAGGGDGDELVFSRDGTKLMIFSYPAGIIAYDVATAKLSEPFGNYKAVAGAISVDGATIAAATQDGEIRLWDTATGKSTRHWTYSGPYVSDMIFAGRDTKIVTTHGDGAVRIWSAADGTLLTTSRAFVDTSWVTQTPDGYFATSAPVEEMFVLQQEGRIVPPGGLLEAYNKPDVIAERLTRLPAAAPPPATPQPVAAPAEQPATAPAPQPSPAPQPTTTSSASAPGIVVSATPSHVLKEAADIRNAAGAEGPVVRRLEAGTLLHVVVAGEAHALVAKDGTLLGYVASSALLKLQ